MRTTPTALHLPAQQPTAEDLATYEEMRAKNLAAARKAADRKKALEALADVVGDYVARPGADPEIRAAYIAACEADQ